MNVMNMTLSELAVRFLALKETNKFLKEKTKKLEDKVKSLESQRDLYRDNLKAERDGINQEIRRVQEALSTPTLYDDKCCPMPLDKSHKYYYQIKAYQDIVKNGTW